jgi:AAA domain
LLSRFQNPELEEALRPSHGAPCIVATPFKWTEPAAIPPRKWLFGRHAIRQFVSATIAPSGAGKTSNSLAESLAYVTGRDFLKDHLVTSGRAWYIGLEDPREEYERRIAALALHYGISPTELTGGLFLDSGRDQDFIIARENRNSIVIAEPVVQGLVDNIMLTKSPISPSTPLSRVTRSARMTTSQSTRSLGNGPISPT